MKKNHWRLLLALVISTASYVGTEIAFKNKTDSRHSDAKSVARLNMSVNEVQRKPTQRVIWESINKNDELYAGEAVRTAPGAEAQLFFPQQGTTIHLDPDSLVVLEQNDKGLSLDFLQGNMFVQSAQNSNDSLTLKTGSGEIKLKSADLSMSKAKDGNVNLEVHRGEAELNQGSKTTSLTKDKTAVLTQTGVNSSERLQVVSPQAGDSIYLNLSKGEKLTLNWKPLPATYSVAIEWGSTRGTMKKLEALQADGKDGKLSFIAKAGSWNLRVLATSSDSKLPPMASAVIPFRIQAKSAPSLSEPRDGSLVRKTEANMPVGFKWLTRHKFESQVIEISTNQNFKTIAAQQVLSGEASSHGTTLADGTYYWRVSGYLKVKDKVETLTSNKFSFKVTSQQESKPPQLKFPQPGQRLSYIDTQKSGVTFKWESPEGNERYKLSVQYKEGNGWISVADKEVEELTHHLSNLKPGSYQWKVATVDSKGGEARFSNPSPFLIEEIPKLEWADNLPGGIYEYPTPTPSLMAHWKPVADPLSTYRYRIANSDEVLETAEWKTTKQNLFDIPVANDGSYLAQAEALNDKGQTVAQSDIKTYIVKRRPLLPAPLWTSNDPLKSDAKGNVKLGWEHVQGAQNYVMILESPDGKVVDQQEIRRNTASLSRLKPGEYQVHVKCVDSLKRLGLESVKRKIQVPATSDIRAPKIKAMKVK